MSFLNPAALWFALISIPIIVFYLLKIRRKEVEISSTLLWRMALRDQQANAPWQKLKRNLVLLLQLIILALMVLAIARLAFPMASISSGSVVILIDGSASMLATDEATNRFSSAIRISEELVREAGANSSASAILVTHQPRILFSRERDINKVAGILTNTEPAHSEADWAAAFSLASGLVVDASESESVTYVILSDGGLPREGLPPLPGSVRYIPIGESADNLAITALSARVLPSGDSAQLFARATNFGNEERAAILTLLKDGEILQRDQIRLAPGDSGTFVLEGLAPIEAVFEARLSNIQANLPLDDFVIDDTAHAVLVPPSVRDVLLVSEGNLFLERLLLLFPNLNASKTVPDENGIVRLGSTSFDLYIFDGVLPEGEMPAGEILFVNPPANEIFEVNGEIEMISNVRPSSHPLAQFIDWSQVSVFKTMQLVLPAWASPLITAEETPLVFIGQHEGQRIAVVGFDLHNSDLPLQVTFPILFANLFDFLAPHGVVSSPNGNTPNGPVQILPGAGTEAIAISKPDGETVVIDLPGSSIQFNETDQSGVYTVRSNDGENFQETSFTVNLFSEVESQIAVREEVEIGRSSITASGHDEISNQEAWSWLIGLALLFLLIEWYAYHRRLGIR